MLSAPEGLLPSDPPGLYVLEQILLHARHVIYISKIYVIMFLRN